MDVEYEDLKEDEIHTKDPFDKDFYLIELNRGEESVVGETFNLHKELLYYFAVWHAVIITLPLSERYRFYREGEEEEEERLWGERTVIGFNVIPEVRLTDVEWIIDYYAYVEEDPERVPRLPSLPDYNKWREKDYKQDLYLAERPEREKPVWPLREDEELYRMVRVLDYLEVEALHQLCYETAVVRYLTAHKEEVLENPPGADLLPGFHLIAETQLADIEWILEYYAFLVANPLPKPAKGMPPPLPHGLTEYIAWRREMGFPKEIDDEPGERLRLLRIVHGLRLEKLHALLLEYSVKVWQDVYERFPTPYVISAESVEQHPGGLVVDPRYKWLRGMRDRAKETLRTSRVLEDIVTPKYICPIACGLTCTLFIKADGTLWFTGSLGERSSVGRFAEFGLSEKVLAVACGANHAMVLLRDGGLWGYGSNALGQLGAEDRELTVNFLMEGVVAVACGNDHTMFITRDATLWACGLAEDGQLGIGNYPDRYLALPRPVAKKMMGLACGFHQSVAISLTGTMWLCGRRGRSFREPRFKEVAKRVKMAACGLEHTMYIESTATLWGIGENHRNQLGVDRKLVRDTENAPITITPNVESVACGSTHTLWLEKAEVGGGARSAGSISLYLGNAMIAVVCGPEYIFALDKNGLLWCGGQDDTNGRLGRGRPVTTESRPFDMLAFSTGYYTPGSSSAKAEKRKRKEEAAEGSEKEPKLQCRTCNSAASTLFHKQLPAFRFCTVRCAERFCTIRHQ